MRNGIVLALLATSMAIVGCGSDPDLPALHPVKGVVTRNKAGFGKGSLIVRADPDNPKVVVVATLAPDGNFELFTILAKDQSGRKHAGAPEGNYKVSFAIASNEQTPAIELETPFTVAAGQTNQWSVELGGHD